MLRCRQYVPRIARVSLSVALATRVIVCAAAGSGTKSMLRIMTGRSNITSVSGQEEWRRAPSIFSHVDGVWSSRERKPDPSPFDAAQAGIADHCC
jgi:hypothetical protein